MPIGSVNLYAVAGVQPKVTTQTKNHSSNIRYMAEKRLQFHMEQCQTRNAKFERDQRLMLYDAPGFEDNLRRMVNQSLAANVYRFADQESYLKWRIRLQMTTLGN